MAGSSKDFTILQGKTFTRVVRWETLPFIYKAITGISRAAPAEATAPGHGMPDGWRSAIVSVVGMREINAAHTPPRSDEFLKGTVVDPDTVAFNDVNSSLFTAYVSGGYLQFYTPVDMDGFTARMSIKDYPGGTLLTPQLTTENGGITIDNTAKTITLSISATDTAAMAARRKAQYELEMVSASGVVTSLLRGEIDIESEVTT